MPIANERLSALSGQRNPKRNIGGRSYYPAASIRRARGFSRVIIAGIELSEATK
jgi:hypothetical protein